METASLPSVTPSVCFSTANGFVEKDSSWLLKSPYKSPWVCVCVYTQVFVCMSL